MPKLEVEGVGTFEVPENKRLVLAIEEDAGVDILHRCGSYARCTTLRSHTAAHARTHGENTEKPTAFEPFRH